MPLGVLATLPDNLWLTIFGVGLVTAGFFGGHSIASSWIGLRAEKARAQASALYLFFYYLGSSVAGSLGGWSLPGRDGRASPPSSAALALLALLVALRLSRVPPPAHLRTVEGGAMEWRDEGLVIGVRRHGEHSAIVEAMTRSHGRHFGLVRGGRSPRLTRGAAARQFARPRLARAARRASRRLRGRASDREGGAADGERAWRSPASTISARWRGSCPSATRTRRSTRR